MNDIPSAIDVTVPATSRRYNVWLGGKDNFAADRASAAAIQDVFQPIGRAIAENRRCLLRVVRYLAAECGIRQFLDIGCGYPAELNVHDVAQQVTADSRVVYVDHDPMVAVHARALWDSTPQGAEVFQDGDLRQPQQILTADLVRTTLDFTRPIGLLLFAVLHFVVDDDGLFDAVQELATALPSGSYVALSHATYDPLPEALLDPMNAFTGAGSPQGPFQPRTHDQVAAFLKGLDLVEPGLVSTVSWRPDLEPTADADLSEAEAICYAAVAMKP